MCGGGSELLRGLDGRLHLSVVGHLLGVLFHAASVVSAAGDGCGRLGPRAGHVGGAEVLGELAESAGRAGVLLEGHHAGDDQRQFAEHQRLEREEPDETQGERQHGDDFHGQQAQDRHDFLLQFSAACTGHGRKTTG